MNIVHVVGARPNFMKVAPVMNSLDRYAGISQTLIHTGQHYDENMSEIFFRQLGLPGPDVNLEVGSGSHVVQIANVMMRFEEFVLDCKPDWVLVYGDVNSTVAAALVSAKLNIPVAHVEAGLRSFDRTMPEEINRILTDQVAELLFTPSVDGNENLIREGVPTEQIHFVGNVMIDTLSRLLPKSRARWGLLQSEFEIVDRQYGLVTLHRPSNVDDSETLRKVMLTLADISRDLRIIFPVHPRTRQRIEVNGLDPTAADGPQLADPLGYLDFLCLQAHAQLVITDSGGIQEETTYLEIPCITVRENTERPVTVDTGTNVLVGRDMHQLRHQVELVMNGVSKCARARLKSMSHPLRWDYETTTRADG